MVSNITEPIKAIFCSFIQRHGDRKTLAEVMESLGGEVYKMRRVVRKRVGVEVKF